MTKKRMFITLFFILIVFSLIKIQINNTTIHGVLEREDATVLEIITVTDKTAFVLIDTGNSILGKLYKKDFFGWKEHSSSSPAVRDQIATPFSKYLSVGEKSE